MAGTGSVVGNTATFTPDAALADNTVYTATVTTAVTDLAGNHLAADYTWSFTTAAAPRPAVAVAAAAVVAVPSSVRAATGEAVPSSS